MFTGSTFLLLNLVLKKVNKRLNLALKARGYTVRALPRHLRHRALARGIESKCYELCRMKYHV